MAEQLSMPKARDVMNRAVHTVDPDMTLSEVIAFLLKHGLSSAPVVEDQGGEAVLVGFVSEHDCLEHLANELFYGTPSPRQTAATIMKLHPISVSPDTELFALTSIFVNHGMRHLPVVEDGRLLGVISRRDILTAMEKQYAAFLRQAEAERQRPDLREVLAQGVVVTPLKKKRK